MDKETLHNDFKFGEWRKNDGRLEFLLPDGSVEYFYDGIVTTGFLPFRKLLLVKDREVLNLSFFAKRDLHKLVLEKLNRIEEAKKLKAINDLKQRTKRDVFISSISGVDSFVHSNLNLGSYNTFHKWREVEKKTEIEKKEDDFKMKVKLEKERIRKILHNVHVNTLNE